MAKQECLENIGGVVVASNKELVAGPNDFYVALPLSTHRGGRVTVQVVWHSGGSGCTWAVDEVVAPYKQQTNVDPAIVYDAYEWLASGLTLTTAAAPSSAQATILDRNPGALRIRATATGTPVVSIYVNRG